MSIVKKLYGLFVGLSLLPIVAVSFLGYATVSNRITTQIYYNANALADRQKQNVQLVLQNGDALANTITVSYDLRHALQAYLAKPSAQSLAIIQNEIGAVRARSASLNVLDTAVVNLDGKILAATTASEVGKQIPNMPPLDQVNRANIVQGSGRIANIEFWRRISLDGVNLGVARVTTTASNLNGVAQDYTSLGEKGQTLLAQKDAKNHSMLITPTRFNQSATLTSAPSSLPFFASDKLHTKIKDDTGAETLMVSRHIANANADWSLLLAMNLSEVFAPLQSLRQTLFISVAAVTILIIAAIAYFARRFTRPIVALTRTTETISAGDFTQKVTIHSKDEIGRLATSFNRMADRLAASYGQLERKVVERTTQLQQKVQEVERAKAKDEAIIGSMGEGMVVTNSQGAVLLVNEIARGLMNLTKEQAGVLDLKAYPFYDDKGVQIPLAQTPLAQVLQKREKLKQDVSITEPNGAKRVINIVASPVVENGTLIGSIQIFRDITKEREVDRMKTEFISLASHQLRTPLSAIKWFSEMLINGDAGELSKEQSEFASNIGASAERMIELVNSLLNISRMESGRIIIDPQPTDLKELVTGVVNDVKAKTEERAQNLIVSVHEDLPKVNLDPHLIGQVYMNLLTNAIKYTPKNGEITVFVSRSGNDVLSQVTDNGYGIPKAQQDRVFQKFFRAENIVKVEADGTGLGLYLIKAIIESSGGKIGFKSEEGKGTTFWFTIPLSGMKAKKGEVTLDEGSAKH
jgi:signal transduction histidine kinase